MCTCCFIQTKFKFRWKSDDSVGACLACSRALPCANPHWWKGKLCTFLLSLSFFFSLYSIFFFFFLRADFLRELLTLRAFYPDISDNDVTTQVHLLLFLWKLTEVKDLMDNGHIFQQHLMYMWEEWLSDLHMKPDYVRHKVWAQNWEGRLRTRTFHHEVLIFLCFSLLQEIWCRVEAVQVVMWECVISFMGREDKGKQACVAWAAVREGGCTPASGASLHLCLLKKADSPQPWVVNLQIECKTALAGVCILCCCGGPSGRKEESWKPLGQAGALELEVTAHWSSWGVLVGFCALGALLHAVDLLLKLILLCFVLHSIDLLKLIWKSTGKGWGGRGWQWAGLGAPPSLFPSTSLRHNSTDHWLVSFQFLSLQDHCEKWSRFKLFWRRKSVRRRAGPCAFCPRSTSVQGMHGWQFCPQLCWSHEQQSGAARMLKPSLCWTALEYHESAFHYVLSSFNDFNNY